MSANRNLNLLLTIFLSFLMCTCAKLLQSFRLFAAPWTIAHQPPLWYPHPVPSLPTPPPPDLWWQHSWSLFQYIFLMFCSVWVFFFNINRFHYKWDHTVFVSVWLSSLNMIPSRSICVVANDRISFFFYGQIVFVCVCERERERECMYHIFFIHLSADT